MANLDNAAAAAAIAAVFDDLANGAVTEAQAAASLLATFNAWYTLPTAYAEQIAGFLLSIPSLIISDGAPSDAFGADGEFALDNTNGALYGPKTSGAWGEPILTLGGEDGRTILSGEGAPGSGVGVDGDFYYDTAASDFYGPKASGAWPAGVSLIGPKGDTGEVAVGTVTTLAPGEDATVTNSGTSTDAVLDFGIPAGAAATVSVGTVSALTPGSTPTVTNSGTNAAAVLDFGLVSGAAATITVGSVTTLAAGESATVTNSGTSAAAVFDIGIPQGPQGEGLHYDTSGPFSGRSAYDAEAAGFVYASTDGADGLGGVAVLYKREGVSGWGAPVEIQGEKGDKGDPGDLVSLEGFVPYATIVTGSGALVPGAAVQFTGATEAVLALDVDAPALGDLYPLSNAGTANMKIDPGAGGGHIAIGSMSAGDRLALEPGDLCTLVCSSLTGPVFTLHDA